jgi:cobalt-zinc-cadmium efflux system protein
LNNRAAFLHVIGDLLGSVAAVAAGVVIYFTGWMPIDPILSLLISILLLVFTLNLIRDIWKTLHLKPGQMAPSLGQHDH